MPNTYTKMCSLLELLQGEWEPEIEDKVFFTECNSTHSIIKKWMPLRKDGDFYYDLSFGKQVKKKDIIYLPDSDKLIAMLEKFLRWHLHCRGKLEPIYWVETEHYNRFFEGSTPQEALLKLVAFERWGLTYNEKDERWE
jgi:hypothetical protein